MQCNISFVNPPFILCYTPSLQLIFLNWFNPFTSGRSLSCILKSQFKNQKYNYFMNAKDFTPLSNNTEANRLAATGAKVDFCMKHYQPFLRHDFSLHHLSVITNIPESNLEIYFRQTTQPFNQYLDEWRVKYAKNLMSKGKVRDMETKTIGLLSGFSSARKFIEAYKRIEGISPEDYQSQIYKAKS